jgi:hypothetical protein
MTREKRPQDPSCIYVPITQNGIRRISERHSSRLSPHNPKPDKEIEQHVYARAQKLLESVESAHGRLASSAEELEPVDEDTGRPRGS